MGCNRQSAVFFTYSPDNVYYLRRKSGGGTIGSPIPFGGATVADIEDIAPTDYLTEEQVKKGYWVQETFGNLQVWHRKNQIALLIITPDIESKVQDIVKGRIQELQEVFEKTGWKPEEDE